MYLMMIRKRVYNISVVKKYVPDRRWLLLNIAKRTQGLLVQKGNPKSLSGIADIARNDVTFVNRQVGSGYENSSRCDAEGKRYRAGFS